jgi:hypothetical protein
MSSIDQMRIDAMWLKCIEIAKLGFLDNGKKIGTTYQIRTTPSGALPVVDEYELDEYYRPTCMDGDGI